MANIEKHGKSLSAEGNVFKGTAKANNYEDSQVYQGPALKEQAVKKYNGPPEIQETQKKSDAYEVVSDNGDNKNTDSVSEGEYKGARVVKVGHPLARAHGSDRHSSHFKGHHRSGLHIVSLDDDDDSTNDKDSDENNLREKDLRLYGSIGSPSSGYLRHKSHRIHHSIYQNDFIPPNVVSFSQDDFSGPLSRGAGHSRGEIFPSFRRRDPFFFSRPSQLQQPEELMQQQFQPVSPKSISFGDRPNMLLLPMYNGNADTSSTVVPMTSQGTFPSSLPQFGAAPLEYSSPPPTGTFRNELLLEPALQVPQVQTQSVNPSYMMPSQSEGQILFNSQQPDVRSLYSLQTQPQIPFPQMALPQIEQPQQPIVPNEAEMQMTPEILSPAGQREIGPAHRWVDEDGRERSEVLDRDRDRQDDDRSQDDRNEDDEDEEEDDRHQSSRYYDRDDDSRPDDGDNDRAQEDPPDENSEDGDEAEEETTDDPTGRMYGSKDTGDEQTSDPDPADENDEDQDPDPPQEGLTQQNMPPFNSNPMTRFMAPSRSFTKFPMPLNTENPAQMAAQEFSRYQLMSPTSALKEHILPKSDGGRPKPSPNIPNSKSDLTFSQLSPAEAQFYENKAAMEPNFTPPISSKDTIPGKSRRFRVGLHNVLIRVNGEPLEDSSQLRSKIINGQIIQGKGKLIKSKGPVRVKLSHTKDAKHLKIIDIIAPKQFQVYDTKSKIRRPGSDVLPETFQ